MSCLQIFLLMVPLLFWQRVVAQTNLYAQVSRAAADLPGGRGWRDTSVQEILLWHGLVLAMTLHHLPSLADYWKQGMVGAVTYLNFSRFMSLVRFEQLKRYLHLNDNSQRPVEKGTGEYSLWHLIPLMNTLKETFKKYWRCGQHVTIDERTIPIRNRMCPIRIYNPAKPYKFGMELFVLVDSLSYYCWDFIVYDKLKTPDLHTVVVVLLVATLLSAGHICILDRGFTSPKLLWSWLSSVKELLALL